MTQPTTSRKTLTISMKIRGSRVRPARKTAIIWGTRSLFRNQATPEAVAAMNMIKDDVVAALTRDRYMALSVNSR